MERNSKTYKTVDSGRGEKYNAIHLANARGKENGERNYKETKINIKIKTKEQKLQQGSSIVLYWQHEELHGSTSQRNLCKLFLKSLEMVLRAYTNEGTLIQECLLTLRKDSESLRHLNRGPLPLLPPSTV